MRSFASPWLSAMAVSRIPASGLSSCPAILNASGASLSTASRPLVSGPAFFLPNGLRPPRRASGLRSSASGEAARAQTTGRDVRTIPGTSASAQHTQLTSSHETLDETIRVGPIEWGKKRSSFN